MDFETFEQLALRAVFETNQPITTSYLSYRTRLPTRVVERYLARMIEQGTLAARATTAGTIEYFVPGAKRGSAPPVPEADSSAMGGELTPLPDQAEHPWPTNPLTAVCLSVLVPGAGHIYSGRPGAGVAWMASTLMGYACCFFPGVFLHGLCMLSAAHAGGRSTPQ